MQNPTAAKKFTARHLTARIITDVLALHPGFSVTGSSRGFATISKFADDSLANRCISSEDRDAARACAKALEAALAGFGNVFIADNGWNISLDFSGVVRSPSSINNCD